MKTLSDRDIAKALNDLAREQMIHKLLRDILQDIQVCKLQNWDKFEYIKRIKQEMERILLNEKDI